MWYMCLCTGLSLNKESMPLVLSQLSELYSYVLSFLIPSCLLRFLFCFHILPTLRHPLSLLMLYLVIFWEFHTMYLDYIHTTHPTNIHPAKTYLPIYPTLNFLPRSDWSISPVCVDKLFLKWKMSWSIFSLRGVRSIKKSSPLLAAMKCQCLLS